MNRGLSVLPNLQRQGNVDQVPAREHGVLQPASVRLLYRGGPTEADPPRRDSLTGAPKDGMPIW